MNPRNPDVDNADPARRAEYLLKKKLNDARRKERSLEKEYGKNWRERYGPENRLYC